MNKMLFAFAVVLAMVTGCATPMTARPSAVPAYAPPPYAAMSQGALPPGMPVPPARPTAMMGPPQNWGWLFTPPAGCEFGPNSLAIANDTDYHARLVLDGQEIQVRGAYGMFPTVPPNSVVYVCLNDTGEHTLSGVMYTLRFGVPQEVIGDRGQFEYRGSFGLANHPSGRNEFHINAATLALM